MDTELRGKIVFGMLGLGLAAAFIQIGLNLGGPVVNHRQVVEYRLDDLAVIAWEKYGVSPLNMPSVVFTPSLNKKHLALADCNTWTLYINDRKAVQNWQYLIQYTLPHEYGHFIVCETAGHIRYDMDGNVWTDPHDSPYWKQIVRDLGGDPNK